METNQREKMPIIVVIILSLTGHSSALLRLGSVSKWSKFSGIVVTYNSSLAETDNVESALQCIMLCLELQTCVSVFYRQVYRRCQIHDVLFLSPQDGEQELGTEYYSLTTGSCPSCYIHARWLDQCYRHNLTSLVNADCAADCASRGEHLIVIDSQEKQDHFKNQITSSSDAVLKSYHIDGQYDKTKGLWVYHNGRPLTFFAWQDGFPKYIDHHSRICMVASRQYNGFLWINGFCTNAKFYMCEKDI